MRFGRDLHRQQVPVWTDSYIDYARLKVKIRTNPPIDEFKEAVSCEISAVEDFISQQGLALGTQIAALNDYWGIEIGASEASHFHRVTRSELEDLQASLVACAEQVQLVHRFVRLNVDALSRILVKAALLEGPEDCLADIDARVKQLSPGPWLSSLNTTLRHIREAIKHKTGAPPRSLLLERGGAHFLPSETVTLLLHDDAPRLKTALHVSYPDESQERQQIIARLLKTAVVISSHGCLDMLLRSLHPKTQPSGLDEYCGDYLHSVVQYLSRLPDHATATDVFHKILKSIRPSPLSLLQHRDQLGRVPLHYAAFAGLEVVCREILELMRDSNILLSQDVLHKTPLDYAVERGHTAVVEIFLNFSASWEDDTHIRGLLATAVRSQFVEIAQALVKQGLGHQFTGKRGENLLHLAAEHSLSPLIGGLVSLGVDINAQVDTRGWTPLTIACIQGHEDTVLAILQAGADASIRDHQGWLAKDHATYRGHTRIVNSITTKGSPILATKAPRVSSIMPRRASTDSVIFVNLGTLDLFKPTPHFNVSQYRKRIFPAQIPDTEFTLSISLAGDSKQEHIVQLPFLLDNSDCPWSFTTDDPENAVLVFKLVNTLESKTVGTAIAMLSSLKGVLGNARESLIRDFTVPLFHHRHTHVGSVLFTFVVAHPYEGTQPPPETAQILKMEPETIIGGHRGNGWNDAAHRLQLGENTLQSFQTAMDLGADLVECDVQITKDNIPVVYHDWLVSEKGCDAPVHTLTYKQLMAVSEAQSNLDSHHTPHKQLPWDERDRPRETLPRLHRRRSLCTPFGSTTDALISQMAHTFNYPGWKPNLRSHSVHGPFLTLEELFRTMPEGAALHIELKYPMLSEAGDFEMDLFAPEINLFVDQILAVTYAHAHARPVILTSFCPEICMLLAVKQTTYPVLFLNDSCNSPTGDRRATSVQAAARFAHRFGLDGIGMAAEPFVACPGLIPFVRGQGLYAASYGALNDEAGCSEAQAEAGIDLVIVNRIRLIKQNLEHWRSLRDGVRVEA